MKTEAGRSYSPNNVQVQTVYSHILVTSGEIIAYMNCVFSRAHILMAS